MPPRARRRPSRAERRERRASLALSGVLCRGVLVLDLALVAERRGLEGLVWRDPRELREEGRRLRVGLARRSVYPLRLRHRALFVLPGRRPHEHRGFRRARLSLARLGLGGLTRALGWRIPSTWAFFSAFSNEWVEGQPRVHAYLAWWIHGVQRGLRLVHRPRGRRGRVGLGARTPGARLARRVSLRRLLVFLGFVVGARVTPPDLGSQRRVALPRVARRETGVRALCLQRALEAEPRVEPSG